MPVSSSSATLAAAVLLRPVRSGRPERSTSATGKLRASRAVAVPSMARILNGFSSCSSISWAASSKARIRARLSTGKGFGGTNVAYTRGLRGWQAHGRPHSPFPGRGGAYFAAPVPFLLLMSHTLRRLLPLLLGLLAATCQRRRPATIPTMKELEGTWLQSREENVGDTLVYRPQHLCFPAVAGPHGLRHQALRPLRAVRHCPYRRPGRPTWHLGYRQAKPLAHSPAREARNPITPWKFWAWTLKNGF